MKEILNAELNGCKYTILGCSVKGTEKGLNQDSFCIEANGEKIICLSADGLGSAINSEIGSQTVCRVARDIIVNNGITDEFPIILKKTWANQLQVKPISCDTTFKFIVIDVNEIVCGGIGDGWIIGIVDNKFFEMKTSNNFSNQTDSIMSVGYENMFHISRIPYNEIQLLSLATDGFSEDMVSNQMENFLRQCLMEINNDSRKFLDDLEHMIENWPISTNQDDKTIILCGRIK